MRTLITGASRGIGLSLVRAALARGDSVFAAARDPEQSQGLKELAGKYGRTLHLIACDVSSDAGVATLSRKVEGPLDALINNAGITGKRGKLAELDFDDMLETYRVNALGALRVTRALWPRLKEGTNARVMNVSTGLASLADNTSGGSYGYRMSKAALNMATKNLAYELAPDGISVVAVNPGWVRTDMGGSAARHSAEETAERLLRILDELTPATSGGFLNFDGKPYVW